MDLKSIQVDKTLEKEGQWIELVDEFHVKIRSVHNTDYRRAVRAQIDRVVDKSRKKRSRLSTEAIEEINIRCAYPHLVVDWRGLEEDGKEVKCNKENVIRIFTELNYLWAIVQEEAGLIKTFRKPTEDEIEGN